MSRADYGTFPDGSHRSRGGAKAIIHVHQALLRQGQPAVIVRRRGKSRHFTRVEILGPSTVIHSATPDRCGARVWIETSADVVGTVEPTTCPANAR